MDNKKAVKAVRKVLNKSDKEKEKEYQLYLKKTKGKTRMSRKYWYKFNYNESPPDEGFKTTRTKSVESQLKNSGLSQKEIDKLRGK